MLLPDRNTIDRLLRCYRSQERLVLARPHDPAARRRFEDTVYTLCVLMGERTGREAARAAERYVAEPSPLRESTLKVCGSTRTGGMTAE
ncbi:DUF5133 domain-containing protein [Streptomyces sp. NPDC056632]|uniref:DUF5133 domain-containing protein n=1 Tax=unclassified Streptomyces TaxID=2593676 RepID=UPI0036CFDA70